MRYRDFSTYVANHQGVSQKQLAGYLGVSTRTVRKYIRQFNNGMDGCAFVERVSESGYRLVITDSESFSLRLDWLDDLVESGLPSTPEQRVSYILNDLLMRSEWVKLDDIAQTLYVSRRTISYDMRKVEERLSAFGLRIIEKPYRGVKVEGTELDKRSCWTSEIGAPIVAGDLSLPDDPVREIAQLVVSWSSRNGLVLDSGCQQCLILHIVIAVARMRSGAYVPMEAIGSADIKEAPCFNLAEELACDVEDCCGITLPFEEIAYIALHLGDPEFLEPGDSVYRDPKDLQAGQIVDDMLLAVYHVFNFDFRDDEELRLNLARHIRPLMSRLGCRSQIDNPLLIDIKRRYPLAYAMAVDASAELLKCCKVAPSDDEVGYIALAFALAIEHMKSSELPKKKALVVCSPGGVQPRLMECLFVKRFSSLLDGIRTCSVDDFREMDLSDVDVVFSAVPIDEEWAFPVIRIDPLLSNEDMERIYRALVDRPRQIDLHKFFNPDLFLPHMSAVNRDDAISQMCRMLMRSSPGEYPDDFPNLVFERECAFSTAFGNRVAMPHPAKAGCSSTTACVGLLDCPVVWDSRGNEVEVVILLSFASGSSEDVSAIMRVLSGFLTDSSLVEKLLTVRTWSSFIAGIEEKVKEGGEIYG